MFVAKPCLNGHVSNIKRTGSVIQNSRTKKEEPTCFHFYSDHVNSLPLPPKVSPLVSKHIKEEEPFHGLGLSNIIKIAEKHKIEKENLQWEIDSLFKENERLKRDTSRLIYEIETLKNEVLKKESTICHLEAQLQSPCNDELIRYNEALQCKNQELQIYVDKLEFNVEKWAYGYKKLEEKNLEYNEMTKVVVELKDSLEKTKNSLNIAKDDLRCLKEENSNLREDMEAMKIGMDQKQRKMVFMYKEKITSLLKQIENLETSIKKLEEDSSKKSLSEKQLMLTRYDGDQKFELKTKNKEQKFAAGDRKSSQNNSNHAPEEVLGRENTDSDVLLERTKNVQNKMWLRLQADSQKSKSKNYSGNENGHVAPELKLQEYIAEYRNEFVRNQEEIELLRSKTRNASISSEINRRLTILKDISSYLTNAEEQLKMIQARMRSSRNALSNTGRMAEFIDYLR